MNKTLKAKIVERYGHQWRFAHALGLPEADVSRVIRGHKALSPDEQRRWAKNLRCDSEVFKGFRDI